ncbi:hypothetical protein TELCIR_17546 [Teladorsagia circumcincta]|uniref:Uncharacterized protein n=1 Tax=Teladorsagia circumcincta TaxID=45464 RepID=A0A2G9TSG7_TELCI|nr:hypothetical protein TELCIR_17546 [Teladorsagia circumcincta]
MPNSLLMTDHIDFNLCDMYSKKRERFRDQNIPIQLCKGMRSPSKESNSNDETVQYHLEAIKTIFVHQCGYKGLGVSSLFSDEILPMVNRRLQKISAEISSNKPSIDKLRELCELQDWEESYWTIIWDNLASSFRDAREFVGLSSIF